MNSIEKCSLNGGLDLDYIGTGESLLEALIFASTNPQYDNRLFIENSKLRTCQEHVVYTNCFLLFF